MKHLRNLWNTNRTAGGDVAAESPHRLQRDAESRRSGWSLARSCMAVAWMFVMSSPAVALAQAGANANAGAAGKSHLQTVLAYALVLFVIALGLLILLRPAYRK